MNVLLLTYIYFSFYCSYVFLNSERKCNPIPAYKDYSNLQFLPFSKQDQVLFKKIIQRGVYL